jgi:hypothetical protein
MAFGKDFYKGFIVGGASIIGLSAIVSGAFYVYALAKGKEILESENIILESEKSQLLRGARDVEIYLAENLLRFNMGDESAFDEDKFNLLQSYERNFLPLLKKDDDTYTSSSLS